METSKRARKIASGSALKKDDISLDAGIWSKLQDHIPLQNVYEKLPYQELFRLRLTCKAWHRAALQRLEPKPYFVIIAYGDGDGCGETYLNGVLSYDVASEKYSFRRQRFPLYCLGYAPFEVEGLIFCQHPETEQSGVFSIHTKMWHAIPPVPEKSESEAAIGMMVDTSERPYSFKLVVGSLDTKTQIYDSQSGSWSTTSSQLKRLSKPALSGCQTVTCMCSNGCVYISIEAEVLLIYSIEGDNWTVMDFPEVKQEEDGGGAVRALGEWEGRIFTTRENCRKRNITVWELVDPSKEEWVKSIIISRKDYDYFMKCDFLNYGPSVYENLGIVPCFCDGYLLIYNWHYSNCQSYALGVMNLATNEWRSVDLPPRTVAIENKVIEEDSDMEEDSDNEGGNEGGYGESSDCDEDAEEDEDTESEASDPGCAAIAIRVRRKTGRSKVDFQRHKGTEAVCSKIAHHRPIGGYEMQLVADQESGATLQSDAPVVTSGSTSASLAEKLSTVGKVVMNPTLTAEAASVDWRKSSPSSWRESMMRNPASKTEKPTIERFKCASCLFGSNALHDYEVHMKTKVHRVIEVLRRETEPDQGCWFPMPLLRDYVASKQQKVNYEVKRRTTPTCPFEAIAVVEGAADGTTDPPTKGFGISYRKKRSAQHYAAADALERIMENVLLDEFINQAMQRFSVKKTSSEKLKPKRKKLKPKREELKPKREELKPKRKPKRKGTGGGNTRGIGSSNAVGEGNIGGIGSSNAVGEGDIGGIDSSSVVVAGGNIRCIDSTSAIGAGGDFGGSGGSVRSGDGGGRGSYPRNPNAVPVTGYNNYSSRAGNLNNVDYRHPAQGGTGFNMSLQGGRGEIDRSRSESYDRTRERYARMQGGRGYGDRREPPAALGYGGRGFHPGIQVYGQPLQARYPVPGNIGQAQYIPTQNFRDLSRSQHVSRNGTENLAREVLHMRSAPLSIESQAQTVRYQANDR